MWKEKLNNYNEITEYVIELNPEIDLVFFENFLIENYGKSVIAVLTNVCIFGLIPGSIENNERDSSKIKYYSKQKKETQPPILIDSQFNIIDGHHRYFISKQRDDEEILVYKIIEQI